MLPMLLHLEVKSHTFYFPLGLLYLLLVPVHLLGAIACLVLLVVPATSRQMRSYIPLIMALPSLLSASIGMQIAYRHISIHII